MKLRIKGNFIRFRLTRSETEYFGEKGLLEEKVEFGNNTFMYCLKKNSNNENLSAEFSENKIVMHVPVKLARDWVETDRTGIEHELNIGKGKKLFLLLEKDFKCLDQVAEDQSDQYENPRAI